MPNPTPQEIAEAKERIAQKISGNNVILHDDAKIILAALDAAEKERDDSLARELKLRENAAELLVSELVYKNGNMDASFQNQPMTKVLAEWAMESFKAHPDAINYLQITFGLAGEEHYEMVVRKESGKMPAQVAAEWKARATRAEARCKELENCGMFLRCALDGALSAMRLPLTECDEIAAWDALINTKPAQSDL